MGSAHPVSQMTTCGTTTHSSRKTSIHSTSHCCLFILLKNYTIIFQHRKVLCKISPVYHLSRLCFKVSARYRTASSLVSNNLPRLAAEWLFETLSTLQELERRSTNIIWDFVNFGNVGKTVNKYWHWLILQGWKSVSLVRSYQRRSL